MPNLDPVDLQLLALLQENGRMAQNDLARAVGLSGPAVSERLRKLEERGVLRGFAALVEPRAVGLDIAAFIFVGISGSRYYPDFRSRVAGLPEVQECHSVTGQGSHLLKIRVENTAALERLLAEVQSWPGVQSTTTSLVLSTVKETPGVPLYAAPEAADEDGPIGSAGLLHVPFRHHT